MSDFNPFAMMTDQNTLRSSSSSVFSHKFVTLILMLMVFTVFSSTLISGTIPIYIIFLCILLHFVLTDIDIMIKINSGEFKYYLYLLLFSGLVSYQMMSNAKILFPLLSILSGIMIVFATKNSIRNTTQLLTIINIFILLHLIAGLLAIMQAFTGKYFHPYIQTPELPGIWFKPAGYETMTFNFGKNYLFPAVFSFMAIKHKLYLRTNIFPKTYLYFIFYFTVFIVILSQNRSTQLALLLMLSYWFFSSKKSFLMVSRRIIILIVLMVTILFTLFNFGQLLDVSGATRLVLWNAGLLMFLDHPLTGVGMGMFKEFYEQYYRALEFIPEYSELILDPHNLLIGIMAGTGLFGSILLFLSHRQIYLYLKKFSPDDARLLVIKKSIGLYLIAFFIDFQFHNYWNDNNIWFFVGLVFSLVDISKK